MNIRYLNHTYLDCRFCHGKGCLACPGEARKAVERGLLDENFVKPNLALKALEEFCRPYTEAFLAEQAALPEHKRGKPRFDEDTQVYRDCPVCDGVGCPECPAEADAEYRRQFPDGIRSALIVSINRMTGTVELGPAF